MQLNSVDLPAPFGPISAAHSPRSTVTDTSISAAIPANRFEIPTASSNGRSAALDVLRPSRSPIRAPSDVGVRLAASASRLAGFPVPDRAHTPGHPASPLRSDDVATKKAEETRDGVALTNLDQPLFEGAGATKRDLVDYLDGVADRILPVLRDRPLSVIRAHRDQAPFMQKNVPKYAPDFVQTVTVWAETSKRDVAYALANDRPTLLWFANQRALEYHPTLVRADDLGHPTHLVLDLDPPEGAPFEVVVQTATWFAPPSTDAGLEGAVKLSGAKGIHIYVPVADDATMADTVAATRALAERAAHRDPSLATTAFVKEERDGKVFVDATRVGGATVVAAYSPRARPGVPVSVPVSWDDLDAIRPGDVTIHNALEHLGGRDPWADSMPAPQALPADLVERGQHDQRRPRPGHARGQAPGPGEASGRRRAGGEDG